MNKKNRKIKQKVFASKNNPLPAKKTVKKMYFRRLRSNKRFKQVMIALSTSLVIGITFGFIFLSMVKQEEPQFASTLHSGTLDTDEEETKESADTQVDSFKFYVVQAGVFSEKENAEEWGENFTNLSFSALTWEQDGQYFVLTGLGTTEADAKKQAEEMEEYDLEVFVKEWEVTHERSSMNEQDELFLQQFLTVWNDTINEGYEHSNWQTLMEMSGLAEKTETFQETIEGMIDQMSETNQTQILLQMIYEYEQLS